MKINEKILQGLSEAQTQIDRKAVGEKYLKILEKIIKNVNFGKLASINGKGTLRGFEIKNNPPKGARGIRDVHYSIYVIVRYTTNSITAEVPGFEMQIRFGENDYWRDIDPPNKPKTGLKRALSKDPGFSEEEIAEKLKELKKIFEEVYNSDEAIINRLLK